MAIDPGISLQVRPAQVTSPIDAMKNAVSIADVISGMNERQQLSKERAVTTKLAQQNLDRTAKQLADQQALETAMDKHWKFDQATGQSTMDDAGALAELPGHLHSTYQATKDAFLNNRNKQLTDELENAHKITEALGVPASNFLAQPEDKRAAAYPDLLKTLGQADPSILTKLPPQYTPEVASKIQEIVDHRAQLQDIGTKVKEAQAQEQMRLLTPEGKQAELDKLNTAAAAQNNTTPEKLDQEIKDANYEKVYGTKITRKTAARAQFSPPLTADRLPSDATDLHGNLISDRNKDNQYVAVMHGTDVLGYQPFEPKATNPTTASLAKQAAEGDLVAAKALKLFPAQANVSMGLTDDAITMAAKKYAAGASLDNLGMNAKAEKAAILNKAAELSKGTDIATQQALYKSNSGALAQLQKSAASVNAFESTALANLDIFQKAAKAVVDSGSPIINKPLRDIDAKALGSSQVAVYQAARQIALTEIAKVLNNPNSSVALSDSARHEAQALIGEGATLKQLYDVVNTLKQDMANRKKGFDDEIAARVQAIQNLSPEAHPAEAIPGAASSTPAGTKIIKYDAQGNRIP